MGQAVGQVDLGRGVERALAAFAAGDTGVDQREFDIALHVKAWQEVEGLEDEADAAIAQTGQAVGARGADVLTGHRDAAGSRGVEAADEVHKGRFSAAARAGNGDKLAGIDAEAHAIERGDRVGSGAVNLVHVNEINGGGRIRSFPHRDG